MTPFELPSQQTSFMRAEAQPEGDVEITRGCSADLATGAEVLVSGIGSAPGTDQLTRQLEVCEGLARADGQVVGVPYLVETPARGPEAGMIGRATALLTGLPTDVQPHGFRISRGGSASRRRAESLLRGDVESFAAILREYEGLVKVAVSGPWTLAASLWLPATERVLSDVSATRDVQQSYGEGLAELVAKVGTSIPGARVVVQVDEPCLTQVVTGTVPTASGLNRVAPVPGEVVRDALDSVASAAREAGAAAVWAHTCAPQVPWDVFSAASFEAVLTDLALWSAADIEAVGQRVDSGSWLGVGLEPRDTGDAVQRIVRVRQVLDVDVRGTVVTPPCGLAGVDEAAFGAHHRALWDVGREIFDKV